MQARWNRCAGRDRLAALFATMLIAGATGACAQGWTPSKPLEIVVPSAPGGSNDKTARTVERILHEKRLVPSAVTVVNKPGGGNMMAMN